MIVTSLFITSCSSDPNDSTTGSGEIKNVSLSESEVKLQKSIAKFEDVCNLLRNLSEYAFWLNKFETGKLSSEEEEKIKRYIISIELESSLPQYYKPGLNEALQNLWPTINDGKSSPLDKITSLIDNFHPGCVYSEIANSSSIIESPANIRADELIAPVPGSGVDISSLPSGTRNSPAFSNGVIQAESFITTGGLTRATYSDLGGLKQSCKFILDTFMFLSGGASTRQQYADFLLGCSIVIQEWY